MSLPTNNQSQPGKVRLSLKVTPSFSIFSESITNFPREPSFHVIQAMPKKIPFFYEIARIDFQENQYILKTPWRLHVHGEKVSSNS